MLDTLTAWFFALWPYLSLLGTVLAVGWATLESAEARQARADLANARRDVRYWMRVAIGDERPPRFEDNLPRRTS